MAEDHPAPDAPTPLTDAARDEVRGIADWCESQRDHAERMAGAQIRMVWILLLLGLALLLVLPRLLQFIDYVGQDDSLPPKVLASFEGTKVIIESNRVELAQELAAAEAAIEAINSSLASQGDKVERIETEIRAALDRPFGVWRWPIPPEEIPRFSVTSIERGQEFAWITGSTPRFERPENDAPGAVIRINESDFFQVIPIQFAEDLLDVVTAISVLDTGNRYLIAARKGDRSLLLTATDLGNWDSAWDGEAGNSGRVNALAKGLDGRIVAGGSLNNSLTRISLGTSRPMLMVSDDGQAWSPVEIPADAGTSGAIHDLMATEDGFFAVGTLDEFGGLFSMVFGNSSNGRDWSWERKPYHQRTLFGGALGSADLAATADGTVLAYIGGTLYQFETATGDWRESETALPAGIRTLIPLSTGEVLTATDTTDRNNRERVELGFVAAGFPAVALEMDGQFLRGAVTAGVEISPDRVLLGGDGYLIESLTATARQDFVNRVIRNARLPQGAVVVVPLKDGTPVRGAMAELFQSLNDARSAVTGWEQRLGAQVTVRDAAQQTLDRQLKVKDDFATLSGELEGALRQAEPIRQLAQIATRLAVIALLIYLVQIVVNRYRYLQRLAGFYQARAQAFRLLAASPDAALLRGVSLADVTAMLSPDAIGFDKSAEPPTGQMVSLLQAGLKRG